MKAGEPEGLSMPYTIQVTANDKISKDNDNAPSMYSLQTVIKKRFNADYLGEGYRLLHIEDIRY